MNKSTKKKCKECGGEDLMWLKLGGRDYYVCHDCSKAYDEFMNKKLGKPNK